MLAGNGAHSMCPGPAQLLMQARPLSGSFLCGSRSRCGVGPEVRNKQNKQNLKDTEEKAGSVLSLCQPSWPS